MFLYSHLLISYVFIVYFLKQEIKWVMCLINGPLSFSYLNLHWFFLNYKSYGLTFKENLFW
jgi:hypothetical protein